ncbi:MAG: UDP-N-acetylglucosamine--LPS N-acetylglucosamine transferase [Leptolyngbyaceae cyanobacterium MAG.088]|nr:UDP-N-acetylglucosamine--LPS N-acetylglucosamine transferase [Leptolyngbyaceae cyanobacterium MAG.088]
MKLVLVASSGGHFSTMNNLKPFWSVHERVWVTDLKSDTAKLRDRCERVFWLPYQGSRELLPFLRNLPATFRILAQAQPDLVISTGPSIAVNFAIASRVFGIRFIYIESISRQQDLSLAGKLIYPICDEFYVQWPELCTKYPKAKFEGYST